MIISIGFWECFNLVINRVKKRNRNRFFSSSANWFPFSSKSSSRSDRMFITVVPHCVVSIGGIVKLVKFSTNSGMLSTLVLDAGGKGGGGGIFVRKLMLGTRASHLSSSRVSIIPLIISAFNPWTIVCSR